jgi:hypothetical protein
MPDRAARLRVGVGAVQACAIPAAGVNLPILKRENGRSFWLAAELLVAPGFFFPCFSYNVMIDP